MSLIPVKHTITQAIAMFFVYTVNLISCTRVYFFWRATIEGG